MTRHASDLDLVDGLFRLSFRLQSLLTRIAATYHLSLVQVRVLGILRDREPGMLELARYLELEKSSLSGLIDRAEIRGLVERVSSADDRRSARVRMTAQGRKLSRLLEADVRTEVLKLVAGLSKSDRERLTDLVEHVLAGASRTVPTS
jgi:DNA-binding MarR family transcriptional regulator